jgi:hypothetical protein
VLAAVSVVVLVLVNPLLVMTRRSDWGAVLR